MVTDPIADLLVRLKNASRVGKTQVSMPYSKMRQSIVEVLSREGYVANLPKRKTGPLVVTLAYKEGRPVIQGTKRVSKPSRRLYSGAHALHPIKHGHGLLVLSTPQGILTGKEAREKNVGGELLFEIW